MSSSARRVADEDLLPKKKTTSTAKTKTSSSGKSSRKASPSMRKVMRAARAVGIGLGAFVTIVGLISLWAIWALRDPPVEDARLEDGE